MGNVKGAVVILDEAHNFIDRLDDLRFKLINEMRDSFKILLLTGTPISSAYSGWQELVILMNIAAGIVTSAVVSMIDTSTVCCEDGTFSSGGAFAVTGMFAYLGSMYTVFVSLLSLAMRTRMTALEII